MKISKKNRGMGVQQRLSTRVYNLDETSHEHPPEPSM